MDDQQELLLSLIEKSVRVIPLDKEEWEAKAGIGASASVANISDDEDEDSGIVSNENDPANTRITSGKGSSSMDDRPLVFLTMNSLRKACLSSSSSPSSGNSSPTTRSRKSLNRKTLIAAVEKWIFQNHSKAQKGKACPCVKVLSNSRLGGDEDTNPLSLLDQYVRAEKAAEGSIATEESEKQKARGKCGCALLTERDYSRSLLLRCNNTLMDGEIFSSKSDSKSSKASSSPSRTAILRCAASLYYRLWYFRTVRRKDLRRAYGFALVSSVSGSGTKTRVSLRISFLLLEKPSESPLSRPSIGGRYSLYVYKTRYDVPKEGVSFLELKQSSSSSLASTSAPSSATIFHELAELLYKHSEVLPCPYKDLPGLSSVRSCPGGMMLPDEHIMGIPEVGGGRASMSTARTSVSSCSISMSSTSPVVPMQIDGCRIVPTITGSLVIYCRNARAVRDLLERSGLEEMEDRSDREGIRELINSFTTVATSTSRRDAWYVKYKTPSYGLYWDQSKHAINAPRGGLIRQGRFQGRKAASHPISVRRWLYLHPIDSWVGNYQSITITKAAGVDFSRAVEEYGLSWPSYQREFLWLAKSTLELQERFNNLVHGDIHEGNVLYYHPRHSERGGNDRHGESGGLFPVGRRLVLIDWDEASRPKPFRRNAQTDEERLRYPGRLLDFPKQYTQQQLLHLYYKLAEKYYPSEFKRIVSGDQSTSADLAWMRDILVPPPATASPGTPSHESPIAKYLSRSAVDQRFKAMVRGLQGECWWTIDWSDHTPSDKARALSKSARW